VRAAAAARARCGSPCVDKQPDGWRRDGNLMAAADLQQTSRPAGPGWGTNIIGIY
jgi:hypothetical protein